MVGVERRKFCCEYRKQTKATVLKLNQQSNKQMGRLLLLLRYMFKCSPLTQIQFIFLRQMPPFCGVSGDRPLNSYPRNETKWSISILDSNLSPCQVIEKFPKVILRSFPFPFPSIASSAILYLCLLVWTLDCIQLRMKRKMVGGNVGLQALQFTVSGWAQRDGIVSTLHRTPDLMWS